MSYGFLENNGVLRIAAQGRISGQELHRLIDDAEALLKDRQPWPDALIDLRALDASGLGFMDMISLSGRKPTVMPTNHLRVAVVSESPMITGAARMLGKHPTVTVEIFPTLDAAEAWLARPRA